MHPLNLRQPHRFINFCVPIFTVMKKKFKYTMLVPAVAATFCSASLFATERLIDAQLSAHDQIHRNKSLAKPSRRGHNYAIIDEGKTKRVIVSGYSKSSPDIPDPKTTLKVNSGNLVAIAPIFKSIPSKYKQYPADSVIPVALPMNALLNMKKGESVKLDLPIGQFTAQYDSTSTDDSGNKTWIGHLSTEGSGYQVILSQGQAGVMGHVITPKGTFNVESDGASTYLIDTRSFQSVGYNGDTIVPNAAMMNAVVQKAALPLKPLQALVNTGKAANADNKKKADASKPRAADKAVNTSTDSQKVATSTLKPRTASASSAVPAETPPVNAVVDLMVLYTTASTTADFAKQRIQYLVAASNQAYTDSGINMTLRLVYTEPTAYSESVSNIKALSDLSSEQDVFAAIQAKRAQYGADLVFLFRPLYAKTHATCGTTYIEFSRGLPANSANAFGTISDGISKDGNSTAYCEINTFTHEIGHSLGLVHEPEHSFLQGAYNYSYAWGVQNKFGTIMSYKSPVVMLFSSPKLATQCAGSPCGFDESNPTKRSDQVKSANLTAQQVADFMPTVVSTAILN
jgi:hypothetical protein